VIEWILTFAASLVLALAAVMLPLYLVGAL
jgi:hypothetical protein